jgi:hypothetical protein
MKIYFNEHDANCYDPWAALTPNQETMRRREGITGAELNGMKIMKSKVK